MPKPLPYREVKRKLEAAGFVETGQKDSHVKFAKITMEGTRTAFVPRHHDISAGVMRSVMRQAGRSQEAFERL